MPKAFSEREKEIIQQRLLAEGYALFSAHGLRKTNVEEITRAAGISKGAFYNFYASKEALFMDVIEQAEERFRAEILTGVAKPGPSPRARLVAILKQAFALLETLPILQFLAGSDYDLVIRRMPPEMLQEHLSNDRTFIDELLARCREAGIPIRVEPHQVLGLLYPLVVAHLHRDDFGPYAFRDSLDVLLELIAAYFLGEMELQA